MAASRTKCYSSSSSTSSPSSARFSWSSNCSTIITPVETYDLALPTPTSTPDTEIELITKARERLAGRQRELEQVIQHCNCEMDVVRRKLCKDLGILEVIKGEIEKAGTGPIRDQLETDFYDEYVAYVATLVEQKKMVDELEKRKRYATRELEGITWSDIVLEARARDHVVATEAGAYE